MYVSNKKEHLRYKGGFGCGVHVLRHLTKGEQAWAIDRFRLLVSYIIKE